MSEITILFTPWIYLGPRTISSPSFVSFRPQKILWHGSSSTGEREPAHFCDSWSTSETDSLGLGSSLAKNLMLEAEEYSCNNAFVVMCIENTSQHDAKK